MLCANCLEVIHHCLVLLYESGNLEVQAEVSFHGRAVLLVIGEELRLNHAVQWQPGKSKRKA